MYVPQAAVSLSHRDGYYHVVLEDGVELLGKAVIIATGVSYRRLEVTGIEKFEGVGVFYSPVDVDHVEAEDPVVIVGGGNSAGQAATALAAAGHPVDLLVRGHGLAETMSAYLLDRIEHDPRITVHTQTAVASVHGDRQLQSVVIQDQSTGKQTEVPTPDLFVMIGAEPRTAWLDDAVQRDRGGFILTGDEIPAAALSDNDWATLDRGPYLLETSLPGVFAVGDVRANSVKRVAAAVGEGSMAVRFAQQYLGQLTS
jgi:thioredoxin reductase (NADPH)